MRERLVRLSMAGTAIAVLAVLAAGLVLVSTWWERLALVGVAIVASALAWFTVTRLAQTVSRPLEELVVGAERGGDGNVVFQPMRSGIPEIDRLSRVFEQRSGEMTRSLANEREFASDASHQLRTPLTALLMRLEEIAASDDVNVVREEAQVGIAQVERLTTVVDELMQRSRTTPEKELARISLDSVIAALQREWQPAFEQARRSVQVTGERGLQVTASRSGLSQIMSTLFENALAHGAGTVQVMARRSGPSVVIEVSDKGTGVDPAIAPHIFERRVSTGGTGLGLALARDLAGASGGRLELRSAQPAVFALFLSEARGAIR